MFYYRKGVPFHPFSETKSVPFHPYDGYRFTQDNFYDPQTFQQVVMGETVPRRVFLYAGLWQGGLDGWLCRHSRSSTPNRDKQPALYEGPPSPFS